MSTRRFAWQPCRNGAYRTFFPRRSAVPRETRTRKAAVSDFHDHCRLGHVKKLPFCLAPGPSEHWRLVQWLRLLDALSGGATTRELAIELIARDTGQYSAAEWDTSSERKRIARWQRQALAMRDGGYIALLSGH